MTRPQLLLLASTIALAVACSGPARPSSTAPKPLDPLARQVEHGARVYRSHCGTCHGWEGHGTAKGPALVGEGALPREPREDSDRTRPFHTALDVAAFATAAMPPRERDRADLTAEDYWAVLAFALSANGLELEGPVGPDNAGSVVLRP